MQKINNNDQTCFYYIYKKNRLINKNIYDDYLNQINFLLTSLCFTISRLGWWIQKIISLYVFPTKLWAKNKYSIKDGLWKK